MKDVIKLFLPEYKFAITKLSVFCALILTVYWYTSPSTKVFFYCSFAGLLTCILTGLFVLKKHARRLEFSKDVITISLYDIWGSELNSVEIRKDDIFEFKNIGNTIKISSKMTDLVLPLGLFKSSEDVVKYFEIYTQKNRTKE